MAGTPPNFLNRFPRAMVRARSVSSRSSDTVKQSVVVRSVDARPYCASRKRELRRSDMRLCVRSLLLLLTCCTSALGQTQTTSYPLKPVRLILGPGPGSVADGLTRVLAASMSELGGQQVIVENRSGAGNTIAPGIVAKAPADGYALHRCGVGDAIAPALYKKLPYDHLRDFALLARIGLTPNIL